MLGEHRSNFFHEPIMSLLCTVTLWAYSLLSESGPAAEGGRQQGLCLTGVGAGAMGSGCGGVGGGGGGGSGRGWNDRNGIIRLDQPTSSDLHEAWIEGRPQLRVYLKGVGNICRAGAAPQILEAGIAALKEHETWHLSQGLALWLSKLKERTAGRKSH